MAKDNNMYEQKFDYEKPENSHYCMPSMYGKLVREQYLAQPNYCDPGPVGGDMKGDRRNEQSGP